MKKLFSLFSLALLTMSAWGAVGVTSLSEANALADGENFTFNGNAVVTICWKGSVYLNDGSGYGQITNYDGTFESGQVLNQGWNATKTSNNGWVKFNDAADLSASGETNAALAAAQKLTSVDESLLNAYVYAENVNKSFLPIRSITLPDGTKLSLTGTGNQPATGNYNIYGIIWKSGDNLVFEPTAWETYVEPPVYLRGDVNMDGNVDIADETDLIDYLLSKDATNVSLENADVNLDGSVDIADATSLVDYLLDKTWPEEVDEMVYTVAGFESVFGSNWDPTDENNNMVKGANGVYTWSKSGVALTGNFEFKIVGNHDWSVYECPAGAYNNYVVNVAEEGVYTIDITFNPEAEEANRITCNLTRTGDIEHVYTVAGTYNLFGEDWDPNFEVNNMVKGDDGIYRLTKSGWFEEGADIRFKVVRDHNWDYAWPAEDFAIGVYKTGAFNFEIVFNPYNNDEDKVHVVITEIF